MILTMTLKWISLSPMMVDNNVGVLLGYGNGSFANQITYPTATSPSHAAVGDFNNDTLPDIVVTKLGTTNVGVFLGYGNGSFANEITYFIGDLAPYSVAVGDFNNDNQTGYCCR